MKKLTITLFLLTLFVVSCQTEADNVGLTSDKNTKTQTEISLQPESKAKDINQKIGIVDGDVEKICFRTKKNNLDENTPVSIVTSLDESPQKVLNAVVKKKLQESCSRRASESTDTNPGKNFYYSLALKDEKVDEYQEVFGIGVIGPEKSFRFQDGLANIDLNSDGKNEFFRKCTGYEGALFAIWKGKPLKGKQIWFSFYYVDYDTEPNCKKKDSEDIDG